jgi:hypothetical protein
MPDIGDRDLFRLFSALFSASLAATRRLTGVARGGALAIARHSLRNGCWAAAGTIKKARNAVTAAEARNMTKPVCRDSGYCIAELRIRHDHNRARLRAGFASSAARNAVLWNTAIKSTALSPCSSLWSSP